MLHAQKFLNTAKSLAYVNLTDNLVFDCPVDELSDAWRGWARLFLLCFIPPGSLVILVQ